MSYPYLPAQLNFRVMNTALNSKRHGSDRVLTPSGRYTLLRELGRGGEGTVLAARDARGRRVAFKRLLDSDHPDARARFRREVELTQRLAHPHIVPVWAVGADIEGRPYYSMPWLDGGQTLRHVIDRLVAGDAETKAEFPIERRVEIMAKACRAVAFAHAQGVVHRDLKPDHILIGRDGEVYVIDWGLAHVTSIEGEARPLRAEPHGTGHDEVLGTPLYMAPEQLRGHIAPGIDVYALSAVLYEALTLKHYLGDPSWDLDELWGQIAREDPFPADLAGAASRQRVPAVLATLCAHGLAKLPQDRPAGADAIADALQSWLRRGTRGVRGFLSRLFG